MLKSLSRKLKGYKDNYEKLHCGGTTSQLLQACRVYRSLYYWRAKGVAEKAL